MKAHLLSLVLFLVTLSILPAQAGLGIQADLTWQGQSWPTDTNGIEASPLYLVPAPTYSLQLDESQLILFNLGLFTDEYVYRRDLAKAFPTQMETGSETGTVAMVLGIRPGALWVYELFPGESFRLGLEAGLSMLFRIALYGIDGSTDIGVITGYLNGSAKFIYPVAGLSARWKIRDNLHVGPYLRAHFPIYRLWDGESMAWWDTMLVSLGFQVRLDL